MPSWGRSVDSLLEALRDYFLANLKDVLPWNVQDVRIMGAWESTAGWSVGLCPMVILTPVGQTEVMGPAVEMRTVNFQVRIRVVMASSDPTSLRIGPASIYALSDQIRLLIAQNKRIGETDDYLNGTRGDTPQTDLDSIGGPGKFVGVDILQTWFRYEHWTGAMNNQTTLAIPA